MNEVFVVVFSSLFQREKKLYALEDWKLLVPLSFKSTANLILCMAIWALPIILIFKGGILSSWFWLLLTFGPPIGFSMIISKPNAVFNNKNFYAWLWCQIRYMTSPKCYADGKSCTIDNTKTNGDFVMWMGDDSQ